MVEIVEYRLIIAGSRSFNNYDLLAKTFEELDFGDYEVSIISGMARGADMLGYQFALANDVKLYEFPADWARYGKRAGIIRNQEMGRFADGLLAFWDGESAGTKHMIDYMKSLNKFVLVKEF